VVNFVVQVVPLIKTCGEILAEMWLIKTQCQAVFQLLFECCQRMVFGMGGRTMFYNSADEGKMSSCEHALEYVIVSFEFCSLAVCLHDWCISVGYHCNVNKINYDFVITPHLLFLVYSFLLMVFQLT